MIRVNGVPMNNPDQGWIYRPASMPYGDMEVELTQIQVAGRDGVIPTPSTLNAPLMRITVNTPPSGWRALMALFRRPELRIERDDHPGLEASARLVSATPNRVFGRNEWIDVTFFVELTGSVWRAKTETTHPVNLTAASVTLDVFTGLTAPVQDAVIRLKGAATGVQVTDASGAWVTLPTATASQYVRFESDTGLCFRTTTDTWTGGVDISGDVDFGGPRGVFEITPVMNMSLLSTKGTVTVASATRSAAVLAVRGKPAYVL